MSLPLSPEPVADHERKPWTAANLSMLCCGLGQFYCGRAARGLVMASLALMLGPIVMTSLLASNSVLWLATFLLSLIGLATVSLVSVVDAYRLARELRGKPYVLRDYNRPAVYTVMLLASVPYALGLALFLRANAVEAFVIPSSSMAPTLMPGDRLLANKLGIDERTIERGELVVFRYSANRRQRYVKRVIGLPGDTVAMQAGQVFVNGQPLRREALGPSATAGKQLAYEWNGGRRYQILTGPDDVQGDFPAQLVPDGAYFVLGDHRGLSVDSRKFHAVSHGELVGIASYLYWPARNWNRFGVLP